MRRSGTADLPLHGGRVPPWLADRMTELGTAIAGLRRSLEAARLGDMQKMDGFRRLDRLTRTVEEDRDPFADFDAALAHEHEIFPSLEGRTVFADRRTKKPAARSAQLNLFGSHAPEL
jgi:hypothetical protein